MFLRNDGNNRSGVGRLAIRPRGLIAGALAAIAVAAALAVSPHTAQAYTYPSHALAPVDCENGGVITVHAPRTFASWYGGTELVEWSSTLQKWGSNGWYNYDPSMPWFVAYANGNGLQASHDVFGQTFTWFRLHSDGTMGSGVSPSQWHYYNNITPGSYRIVNFYYWPRAGVQTPGEPSVYYNDNNTITPWFCTYTAA